MLSTNPRRFEMVYSDVMFPQDLFVCHDEIGADAAVP